MAEIEIPASLAVEAQSKGYGKRLGVYRFRIRSWEVVATFFTLLFGFFILTGLTDPDSPLDVLVAIGVMGGGLWLYGLGLLVRWLVRRRNLVAVYEHGMIIARRKTDAIQRSFPWSAVEVIREYARAAGYHQGEQVMDASSRMWLRLKDGTKLAFVNTLTDMEAVCSFVRAGVGEVQKEGLLDKWERDGEVIVGTLLLDRNGLRAGGFWRTKTILWPQVVTYKCGTEALEFRIDNGQSIQQVKINWSKLPNLGAVDALIKYILASR